MTAWTRVAMAGALWALVGCGNAGPDTGGKDPGSVDTGTTAGPPFDDMLLSTSTGCEGVFNQGQVLDYYLTLPAADWNALLADSTASVYFQASFRCGNEPETVVGIKRRSSGVDKVGLKVDTNRIVAAQRHHDLKKLTFDPGMGAADPSGKSVDMLAEYLSWRAMAMAGLHASRIAFARIHVNGVLQGVYTNIETVDLRFLKARLGDGSGWLYKRSGGDGDGYQTRTGEVNPYEAYFCFLDDPPCAVPGDLATSLPDKLDLDQLVGLGAVNALLANEDGPLAYHNNFYTYDIEGGRVYLPWDLDKMLEVPFDVFRTVPPIGGVSFYFDTVFSNWDADYDAFLTDKLANELSAAAVQAELDAAVSLIGSAMDADPLLTGTAAAAASDLSARWQARHAEVQQQVAKH